MPTIPPNPPPRYLSAEMLTRLGQITGHQFDLERLHQLLEVVHNRAEGDPLAQLALTGDELGLRLTPARLPLAEAIWKAHADTPVVLWSEPEERFYIISRASAFKVRLASFDDISGGATTISRARLARRLGLKSVNQEVEAALIQSQTPTGRASAATEKKEASRLHRTAKRSHRKGAHDSPSSEHGGGSGDGKGHGDHHHHHMPPFRRFLRILQPERRDILTLVIFAMFSGVLYLALPLAVDRVVTNLAFGGQAQPYVQALFAIAKILAVCLSLQALIIAFQYYIAEVIQRRIFVRTASDLAFRLPRVNAKAFDDVHGPELVNRFLDVVTVQKNTAFFLLEGINVVAASLIGMVLLSLYHPLLLAFVGLLVVLIIVVTWLLGRGAVRTAILESRTKYDLVGWFEEIAAYPFMFKGSGGYELAYQRTNMLATEFVNARTKHFGNVFRQVSGLLILSIFASVTLLVLGTWLVLSQQITLGQLVASELIMSGIVVALIKLGKKLEAWYDTLAAVDKLGHIFDLETESISGEEPSTAASTKGMQVKVCDLSFGYRDKDLLFSKRSFELQPGERLAIYGPQGSGVSSLLDLLFAVREPSQGHLSFDGLDSRSWQLERLRESVQLLRRDEFIDGTVIENLRLGRPEIGLDEIRVALEKVGILDDILRHPDGLNLRLRLGGAPLSTSQRICLLFARALVQKPRLLLVDELFDGLDEKTFQRLTRVTLNSDLPWSVIVATRINEAISLCDQVIDLSHPKAPQQPAKTSAPFLT